MGELFWLTDAQTERLRPFFPKSRGKPRGDDRRVLGGIIFIQRNGLMWKYAPREYGPPKTLHNRWKRWSRMGVFATIMTELAAQAQDTGIVMIDAPQPRAHQRLKALGQVRDVGHQPGAFGDVRRARAVAGRQ